MSNTTRQNTPREVNEFALLTDPTLAFKNPAQLTFIRILLDILRQLTGQVIRRDQGSPRLILTDPDGGAWVVTVDSNGVLHTSNARAV